MKELFEKLERILKNELDVHHTFVTTAQVFNSAVREDNIGEIDRQRTAQDETICRIEKLEEERILCCSNLAARMGITRKPVKIALLIGKMPAEWRDRIAEVHRALKQKLMELSKITVSNRILLEEGLKVVTHTFSLIQQGEKRYAVYEQRGRTAPAGTLQSIINRTV
jgi:hypothetical protein